jgi:hypothetical protein
MKCKEKGFEVFTAVVMKFYLLYLLGYNAV